MSQKNTKSESSQLNAARLIISNSLKAPSVSESLTKFGYDPEKLNQGKILLNEVESLIARQKREYGDQYNATDAMYKNYEEGRSLYMQHVKLARLALKKDPALGKSLQLQGERKKTISDWLTQARIFYENALNQDEVIEALNRFGIDKFALERGRELVDKVAKAMAEQRKEMGDAQSSTSAKYQAMNALNEWVSELKAVARIALQDDPQQLEALGIIIPSK